MSEPNRSNETIVCGRRPAPGGLPEPLCWYPVWNEAEQCLKACGKPAILVDHLFPVYWAENRCEQHAELEATPESLHAVRNAPTPTGD